MTNQSLRAADVNEGTELPKLVVEKLSRTDIVKYAGASGDFNPIHHDQSFAEAAGYPTVFAHGMLSAGFLGKCVTDFVGVQSLRKYSLAFRAQVWPGDTITFGGKVTRKLEADGEKRIEGELVATNQKGETVITGAFVAAVAG